MAKAIEQTPVLEGEDSIRFCDILENSKELNHAEIKLKSMVKNLPKKLKF